jgi:hypothetical protein
MPVTDKGHEIRHVDNGSLRNGRRGMLWIDLVQDTGTLRDIVHAVMNLLVPSNAGGFVYQMRALLASLRWLCSVLRKGTHL